MFRWEIIEIHLNFHKEMFLRMKLRVVGGGAPPICCDLGSIHIGCVSVSVVAIKAYIRKTRRKKCF